MAKKKSERRRHARRDVACPVAIAGGGDSRTARGKTLNISDSGALLSVPIEYLPDVTKQVNISVSVPRATANTYMFEEFQSRATVTRHEPMIDDRLAGVAVRFDRVLEFNLQA